MNASASATCDALNQHAYRLKELASQLGLDDLGETILEDTARRLHDTRIRAVVLGEIKQGKSSLLNALVGQSILPTGVTPTTGTTVVVRGGENPGPYLERPDAGPLALETERFHRLVKGPAADAEAHVEIEVEAGRLVYEVATEALPPQLELVDTPGINDVATYRAAVSRGELLRADILLLTLDATQLLNRTELAFLRDAVAAVGGVTDSGATLLLAVNRIDLIAERERPRLVKYIEDELLQVGESDQPLRYELFLTDARTALREPDARSAGVEGVAALRDRLHELARARADVLPLRARAGLVRHASLLGYNASVAARALSVEARVLAREIERFERELESRETDLTAIRTVMDRLRQETLEASAERQRKFKERLLQTTTEALRTMTVRTLTSQLAGALHDAYLQFAHSEADTLRSALDEMTRQAILAHSEQAQRRIYQATLRLGFIGPPIYVDPPGALLEAGLVAVGVAGTAVMYLGNAITGLLMAIAGPLTTLVLREKSLRNGRARVAEELPRALDQADAAFRGQIRNVVDQHVAALDEHLQLANVALGDQLRRVLQRAHTRPEQTQELAAIREVERELTGIREQLGRL